MCPAAVDWEAAWPTRRSLAYGADEDDEAKVSVFTQSPARSATSPGHERGTDRGRNRSASPGRGVIPPAISSEAKAGQAEHAIGALVSYWSGTHLQWMDAKVTRQNFDARGLLLAYDLDVKRGAQANKIRKRSQPSDLLEQQTNQSPLPASMVQRSPTPVSNTATGLGEPAHPIGVHQVAQPVGDSSPQPSVGPSPGALTAAADPVVATQAVSAASITSKIAGLAPTPGGAGITGALAIAPTPSPGLGPSAVAADHQPPRADLQAPPSEAPDVSSLCSFNVGDKVEYWSGTYSQWMTAKVERVRTDTSLYDLDVKRGAQRKKIRELRGGAGPDAPNPAATPTQVGSASFSTAKPADKVVAPPSALMPVRPVLKSASTAQSGAAWTAATNTSAGTTTSASPSHPPQGTTTLRSTDREAVTSSRLRGVSRDTQVGDDDVTPSPKLANAPGKITVPGAYPRSGSPLLNGRPQEKSGALIGAGASQNALAGDPNLSGPQLEGRNRTFAGGALAMNRGRHDLGRPGPISSGSLGLASSSLGEGVRPAIPGTLTPSGLVAGSKAPHRVLPDSSAGPTIGTRPDTTIATSSGSGASLAGSSAGGVRGGIVGNITGGVAQARGLGHVTINGVAKKVDLNGFVSGGVSSCDKVQVQRDGDKVVVRQLPGTVPAATFTNGPTPSTSSHRPPPSTTTVAASAAASTPAIRWAPTAKKAPEESQTETARNGVQLEGLEACSPADLILLIRDLCADCLDEEDLALLEELEPEDTRAQIVAALGRLSIQDLGKRLAEAHVDASVCKERKELESLLLLTILSRQRGSETPTRLHMSPPSLPATPERRVSPPACVSNGARESCPSELVATGLSGASVAEQTGLEVGELDIGSGRFDPTQPELRAQLTAGLGFSPNSTIEEMTGFRGGLNEGVWFLSDQPQSPPVKDLVLKLVKCNRISSRILTEAENFVKINNDHPQIARDPGVAFPVRIFKCHGPAPERLHRYDLIVMWKVHGERLTEWIAHKWYSKAFEELWQIFDRLGHIIYAFHDRYCDSQHGDFQPSNVFYDEESGDISLIDIGGMGVATSEGDVDHFSKSLKLLADAYGSQLLQGTGRFEAAYAEARAR